jgi:hypothetical protein
MKARKVFDKALTKHLEYFHEEEHCSVVLAGDLNVCPRVLDFHPVAFLQCAKLKEKSTLKDDPGCSVQEVSMYHEMVRKMKGYNVWEKLKPTSTRGMTWHSATDRAAKIYDTGLRIDHFIVTKEMMRGDHKWQVKDIRVFQGVGSSDHCPLVLRFEKRDPEKEARKKELRRSDSVVKHLVPQVSAGKGPIIYDIATGRSKEFDAYECPIIDMIVGGTIQRVFIDTGSPFTIYNPPTDEVQRDIIEKVMRPSNSRSNCHFQGVGGSAIKAVGNGF